MPVSCLYKNLNHFSLLSKYIYDICLNSNANNKPKIKQPGTSVILQKQQLRHLVYSSSQTAVKLIMLLTMKFVKLMQVIFLIVSEHIDNGF